MYLAKELSSFFSGGILSVCLLAAQQSSQIAFTLLPDNDVLLSYRCFRVHIGALWYYQPDPPAEREISSSSSPGKSLQSLPFTVFVVGVVVFPTSLKV